ncbi:MAG: hypothetical protein CMP05_04535 [Xanthomarina sp.]|uniref:Uncharacterized protein n=1 Tax=Xanthomarina gelatinilytica TaxID=1137281 RepID=A0A3C0F2P7_9FLAO|nr:hypothetical protein [Xanthomarina sp.]HAB28102.1 hypothetical protein [Xanthomarina gelatinilytica]MAL21627.1 hypothetical protein [Xanthomarina sp.]MBF61248.1 hypothetical protein [Xanthomarina sp.]HAI17659.1 hypothetical protein [Xanthomarina gelatinilytica]HCY82263.1 hypothetical protein [Xanthomarina gelatinilytica]|tara:strand:+ start:371 stop:622 length:252 start_codon:yes stop_codon:yes gene_type:complete
MNLKERYTKPTPKFFKILRNIGIALTAAGGAILAAPVSIPATIITAATYMTVAGTVASVVSQAVVKDGDDDEPKDFDNSALIK